MRLEEMNHYHFAMEEPFFNLSFGQMDTIESNI
ncbi:hypothetical protein K3495_g8980 [Podosphaera aphanis]|nr:hypothetical protein K3495_g8980 [Podosphaera aphanis]